MEHTVPSSDLNFYWIPNASLPPCLNCKEKCTNKIHSEKEGWLCEKCWKEVFDEMKDQWHLKK